MGSSTNNGRTVKLTPIGGYYGVIYRDERGRLHLSGLDAEALNDDLRFHEAEAYARRDFYRKQGRWSQVIQFGKRDAASVGELLEEYDDLDFNLVRDTLSDEDFAEMAQATSMAHLRCASDEATAHTAMERWSARTRD